jgi:hypothetical protein
MNQIAVNVPSEVRGHLIVLPEAFSIIGELGEVASRVSGGHALLIHVSGLNNRQMCWGALVHAFGQLVEQVVAEHRLIAESVTRLYELGARFLEKLLGFDEKNRHIEGVTLYTNTFTPFATSTSPAPTRT